MYFNTSAALLVAAGFIFLIALGATYGIEKIRKGRTKKPDEGQPASNNMQD